jgi:acyl carrier protein
MTDQDILQALSEILGDLLNDESIVLKMDTRREDVPDWDSLAYVNFIAMAEMRFGVKFRVSEIESFNNVAAVVAGINAKRGAK